MLIALGMHIPHTERKILRQYIDTANDKKVSLDEWSAFMEGDRDAEAEERNILAAAASEAVQEVEQKEEEEEEQQQEEADEEEREIDAEEQQVRSAKCTQRFRLNHMSLWV